MSPNTTSDRLPITRRHPLYPLLALYALVALLFGPVGRQMSDDMPESKTHPYFPDHVWPYPILAMAVLITLGLLALVGQPLLQPGQAADPRAAIIPRPEWYFLALFQFAKLGPALITRMLVPAAMGTSDQVASNTTKDGQAQNRRTVIRLLQNRGITGN